MKNVTSNASFRSVAKVDEGVILHSHWKNGVKLTRSAKLTMNFLIDENRNEKRAF